LLLYHPLVADGLALALESAGGLDGLSVRDRRCEVVSFGSSGGLPGGVCLSYSAWFGLPGSQPAKLAVNTMLPTSRKALARLDVRIDILLPYYLVMKTTGKIRKQTGDKTICRPS